MTVPQQTPYKSYTGNGVTTAYPIGFLCLQAGDLGVYVNGAKLTLVDYTITDLTADTGGTVTFNVAPADGVQVFFNLEVVPERLTDYKYAGDFFSSVVNGDFDRIWLAIQQGFLANSRALTLGVGDQDGAGSYRAKQNRIQDLADPIASQDAVNLRWVQQQLADLATDGSGQFVMQALAEQNDPTQGAGLIGYKGTTLYNFLQDKFLLDPFFYVTSRSAAAARDIPPVVSRIFVGGYTVEGDCEPMWFEAVADTGTLQPWQFRSNGATRRWELRMRGMVTPEMFGAKRDGITNDRDAIVNAMLFCHAIGGGKVECLPGTYFITNSIAATGINGVTLTSRVPRAATIKIPQVATPGGGLPSHIIVLTNCSNIEVSGLALLGNRQVSNTYTAFCGIYLISCQNYKIKNNAISWVESICISVNTGCVNGDVSDNYLNNASSGIWLFKGNINADINRNRIDLMQIHGILTDDATSADTTPATSSPNQYIRIDDNFITNFSLSGGLGAGVVMSGQVGGSITNNDIAVGGVNGTSAASGIVVNSGQDTYNKCDGVVISDNRIRDIYGGAGITLQGAHGCTVQGNSMWNLFLWPTSLSGAAINIVEDVAGAHSVSLQRTQYNIVGGNTVRANGNTQYAVQLGANTLANCIYKQQCLGVGVTDVQVVTGTGQGQLHFKGYGALPTYNLGWRGAQWHNTTDDRLYIATNTAWVVVGTQT